MNSIQLNGLIYNKTNLTELFVADEPLDSWRNAIYLFLLNWFDNTDYILAHTSGSTGNPKGIRLKKKAMENSARMTNRFFGLEASKTALLCLPASYIAGKMMLVRALGGGFNLLTTEPKANPFENLNTEIDFAAITPYQLSYSAETLKTKLVRQIIVGGSPVTKKLEQISETIPSELFETYGMTETCSHIALRRFNGIRKSEFFTTLEGISIRLDNRGCLAIVAEHLIENEIFSNDRVELVGTNSFRWLGRTDSTINSGGVKIQPEEIEKNLENCIPTNYFISSIPDEELLNKTVLVIESDCYSIEQELLLKLKMSELLPKFAIPKLILYIPSFVYSSSNKVLKSQTLSKGMQ